MVVLSGGKAEQARKLTPRTAAQLDAAQAKVGVGEDFRAPARQVGVGDLLAGGGGDRRGKLGQVLLAQHGPGTR